MTTTDTRAPRPLATRSASGIDRAAVGIESLWGSAFRRLRRNRVAFISAIFILTIAAMAVVVPEIASTGYADQNYDVVTQGQAGPTPWAPTSWGATS